MIKKYFPFLIICSIVLSSCTSEDNVIENENKALIKSYKISRDAQGRYSIDYDLVDGISSEIAKDVTTNSNNIYTYETERSYQEKKTKFLNENLKLDNNEIKIGLFENNEKRRSITIEDENIVMAKGKNNPDFLQEYSVEHLGTDEYVLDFKVRKGVNVGFEYNDEDNIYEVHLKEGVSNGTTFTKLYKKSSSLPLKIDFVNYVRYHAYSKNENSSLVLYSVKKNRVPRVVEQSI